MLGSKDNVSYSVNCSQLRMHQLSSVIGSVQHQLLGWNVYLIVKELQLRVTACDDHVRHVCLSCQVLLCMWHDRCCVVLCSARSL